MQPTATDRYAESYAATARDRLWPFWATQGAHRNDRYPSEAVGQLAWANDN
jgi:hypothetical protein